MNRLQKIAKVQTHPSVLEVNAAGLVDHDERFASRRFMEAIRRLLAHTADLDRDAIEVVVWLLGSVQSETLRRDLVAALGSKEERHSFAEADDDDDIIYALLRFVSRSQRRRRGALKMIDAYLARRHRAIRLRGRAPVEKARDQVTEMLGLTDREADYLFWGYLCGTWDKIGNYFASDLESFSPVGRKHLAAVLGLSVGEVARLQRGRLKTLDFIDPSLQSFGLSDEVHALFEQAGDVRGASAGLFSKATRTSLPLEAHSLDPSETEHILSLLGRRSAGAATHILLYGPPGTGKTSYARALVQELAPGRAYEVLPRSGDPRVSARAAVMACVNMTAAAEGSVVIVDEADALLDTTTDMFRRATPTAGDKVWLNELLERPGLRMIWICNDVSGIDPAVSRRFAYSVVFQPLGRRERRALWQTIVKRRRVRRLLADVEMARFAADFVASAGVIDLAVVTAKRVAGGKRRAFVVALRQALGAHETLSRGGKPNSRQNTERVASSFMPTALVTSVDVDTIRATAKAADARLRRARLAGRSTREPVIGSNLLFFGPPGTGKSELARYLANELERPLIAKRASEVVSKWVGDTERNLAAAFREAEGEEGLLVLDEVDTLLYRREDAIRSWEISATNELLTQLERFSGIVVATTNRLDGLDPAALRRFQLKVGFDYLTNEGKVILFEKMLVPLCRDPFGDAERARLADIGPLTPGDFAVVATQARWRDATSFDELSAA
ncbi:MAG: ATP-binding protein, partial [Deltaproteobacteria bacterium]|nr:ATP-binding protein [Deltaproteobacteria bacterium]